MIINNTLRKLGVISLSILFIMSGAGALSVKADTNDIQTQIASLIAQIQALQTQLNGGIAGCSFTRDLTIGARGTYVTCLQNYLIAHGFVIPAGATGYFGTQTRVATGSWQAANGVSPTAGYFGAISRARYLALAQVNPTPTPTPGGITLSGHGRLTNISTLGDVTSDIKEGDGATKLAGVSVDATDGDVLLQRVDATITLDSSGNQSSSIDRYFDSVSVYVDGNKVATMDATNGDKNGRVWIYRFSGINTKIQSGHTSNIYVEAIPVTSIGTNETGKGGTIALDANALRYAGADGISETYGTSISQSFTISAATTGKLTFTEGSGDPSASVVKVDTNNTTTGVKILEINARAKNDDITVNDLAVQIATSDNNLSDVIQTVSLMDGSTVIRSKSVGSGTTGTIIFDNVNRDISKDSSATWSIAVDLKKESAYADGTTLIASTTSTLAGHDVEDSNGNTVTISGAAVGHIQTLQTTGINVSSVSNSSTVRSATIAGQADIVDNTIVFKVTAGDDDLFIEGDLAQGVVSPTVSTDGLSWATTTDSNTGSASGYSATLTASDTQNGDVTTSGAQAFKIPAGSSRTFTLSVSIPTSIDNGQVGVRITGIKYNVTSNTGDVLGAVFMSNLDTFKTTTRTGLNVL